MIWRQDDAGSRFGGYATWQLPHSAFQLLLVATDPLGSAMALSIKRPNANSSETDQTIESKIRRLTVLFMTVSYFASDMR